MSNNVYQRQSKNLWGEPKGGSSPMLFEVGTRIGPPTTFMMTLPKSVSDRGIERVIVNGRVFMPQPENVAVVKHPRLNLAKRKKK